VAGVREAYRHILQTSLPQITILSFKQKLLLQATTIMTSFVDFQNQKSGEHVYDQDVLDEAMELKHIWAVDIGISHACQSMDSISKIHSGQSRDSNSRHYKNTDASLDTTSTYVESRTSASSGSTNTSTVDEDTHSSRVLASSGSFESYDVTDEEFSYKEVLPKVFRCTGKGKRALCPRIPFVSQNYSPDDSDDKSVGSILAEKIQSSPSLIGHQFVPDGNLKTKDSFDNRTEQVRNFLSRQAVTPADGDDRLITPKPFFLTKESFDDLKEQGGNFLSCKASPTTNDISPPPPRPIFCTKDSFDDLKEQSGNFLSCKTASSKQLPFNHSRNVSLLETHSDSMMSTFDAEEVTSLPFADAGSKDRGTVCTVREATDKAFVFGRALGFMIDSMNKKADYFTDKLIIDDLASKPSSLGDAGTEDKRGVQQPCPYRATKCNAYVMAPDNEKMNEILCLADRVLIDTDDGDVEISIFPEYQLEEENMPTTKIADRAKLDQSSLADHCLKFLFVPRDSKAEELASRIDNDSCSVAIDERFGLTDVINIDMRNGSVELSLSPDFYEPLERNPAVSKQPLDVESCNTQRHAAFIKPHLPLLELEADALAQIISILCHLLRPDTLVEPEETNPAMQLQVLQQMNGNFSRAAKRFSVAPQPGSEKHANALKTILDEKENLKSTAVAALSTLAPAKVGGKEHESVDFSKLAAELRIIEGLAAPNAYNNLQRFLHGQDLRHNVCSSREYIFPLSPAASLVQPFSPRSERNGAQSANLFSLEIPVYQFGHEEPASRSPFIPPCTISQAKRKGLFTGESLFRAASDAFHLTSNKPPGCSEANPAKECLDLSSGLCGVDESMGFPNLVVIHPGGKYESESTEIKPNTALQALLDDSGNKKSMLSNTNRRRRRPREWTADELNKIAADVLHFDLVDFQSKIVEDNWSEPQWTGPETLLIHAAQQQFRKISLPARKNFPADEKLMTDTTHERVASLPLHRAEHDFMDCLPTEVTKAVEFAPDGGSDTLLLTQPKSCDITEVVVVQQKRDELSDKQLAEPKYTYNEWLQIFSAAQQPTTVCRPTSVALALDTLEAKTLSMQPENENDEYQVAVDIDAIHPDPVVEIEPKGTGIESPSGQVNQQKPNEIGHPMDEHRGNEDSVDDPIPEKEKLPQLAT
jgi:hypothetical protein